MTLLQAIKEAARIAAHAPYDGEVAIQKDEKGRYFIAEFTDHSSFMPDYELVYKMNTYPYEMESQTALIKEARERLKV